MPLETKQKKMYNIKRYVHKSAFGNTSEKQSRYHKQLGIIKRGGETS